jgi:hypothetical protein
MKRQHVLLLPVTLFVAACGSTSAPKVEPLRVFDPTGATRIELTSADVAKKRGSVWAVQGTPSPPSFILIARLTTRGARKLRRLVHAIASRSHRTHKLQAFVVELDGRLRFHFPVIYRTEHVWSTGATTGLQIGGLRRSEALRVARELGGREAIVGASTVPLSVQRAIRKKVSAPLRYVPTEVPIGYRYATWNGGRHGLNIYFARAGRAPALGFHALASGGAGTCKQGGTRTYRFAPARVSFESDRYSEQYWRCVRGGTVSIEATSRHADGSTAARRRAIAAMVASAIRLD